MNKSNQKTATSKVVSDNLVETAGVSSVSRTADFSKASKPTGKGGSGSVSETRVLTLVDGYKDHMSKVCRQESLVISYLEALGGSACIGELNDLASEVKEGEFKWAYASGTKYEQDPQEILKTYLGRLTGNKVWSKDLVEKLTLMS
tara:strand:+ start:311 stop:748 length:438 start_codon:yes stop_codon:yes gene_type:complete